jgi:uncharacterized membrane protein
MSAWLPYLTLLAALGCGIVGGVFYAFSSFVMKALLRLAPAEGVRAMQSINVVVINPSFLGVFLGTAVLCTVLGVGSVVAWDGLRLAGCVLYVAGTFVVTMLFNVPRNNALEKLDPEIEGAAEHWARYAREWTAYNHVRTAAALLAAALLIVAHDD